MQTFAQPIGHNSPLQKCTLFVFSITLHSECTTKDLMTEKIPLTMKDIARELGVSVATVSRALKDSPRISAERRAMIQQYAREHNFIPNVIAESLRFARVQPLRVLGVIIPDFVHYYFASVLSGIEQEAKRRGYFVMVTQSAENFEREVAICQSFYENKVCGIIVSQAKETHQYEHFQRLLDAGLPLVFFDRICTGVDASRVVVDDYMGAFNAVNYLIKTGCRRIAYYGSQMNLEIAKNRFNGYKDALLKNKLPFREELTRICDNRQDAELVTPDMFDGDEYPDAFFTVNDDTALGVLYTVKRMGLRVPEDVSICGFTNGVRAISCDPMLTTVEQDGLKVGEEAADVLINLVEGKIPYDKIEKRVVRTRLIIRGTTR